MKKILSSIQRAKKWIALGVLFVLIFSIFLISYAKSPIDDQGVGVTVYLPKGTGFVAIVDILDQKGMVKNKLFFTLLVLFKGVAGQMKAGEYELATSMSPGEIIDKLAKGDIKIHEVTIPEDLTLKQIADILVDEQLVNEDAFFSVTTDPDFLKSLNIDARSAEGYLYPDTYQFNRSMTTREIVRIMVKQFRKKVTPQMVKKAQNMGMTPIEFVTLASLIGKESGHKGEKSQVSAVFHNRLKKGMRLQCDPTAVYSLRTFQSVVKRKDLDNDTPYNTYKIPGLPPGPIANPGFDSLQAALDPAPVPDLYFVSKNDGTHVFSATLAAHTQAVLKYHVKRKKE